MTTRIKTKLGKSRTFRDKLRQHNCGVGVMAAFLGFGGICGWNLAFGHHRDTITTCFPCQESSIASGKGPVGFCWSVVVATGPGIGNKTRQGHGVRSLDAIIYMTGQIKNKQTEMRSRFPPDLLLFMSSHQRTKPVPRCANLETKDGRTGARPRGHGCSKGA